MSDKYKKYDVTIFNMNSGLDENGQPKETEVVGVCAKTKESAERIAINVGLVNAQSGWGVWDSVNVL